MVSVGEKGKTNTPEVGEKTSKKALQGKKR